MTEVRSPVPPRPEPALLGPDGEPILYRTEAEVPRRPIGFRPPGDMTRYIPTGLLPRPGSRVPVLVRGA